MRKWICYGISFVCSLLCYGYILLKLDMAGGGWDAGFLVSVLCNMAAAVALTGSSCEMASLLIAWKPKECQQHELRLRWCMAGLYYECTACGRHWLTRRSWHLPRLLGTLAVWFLFSLSLTLVLPALLKGVMSMSVIVALLGFCYCVLLISIPTLANYLTYRRLKDKAPQEHLGWAMSRVTLP